MKQPSHCRKLLQDGATLQAIIQPSTNGSSTTIQPSVNGSSTADKRPLQSQTHFDSSMALTILVVLVALFFVAFLSMYIRRLSAADDSPSSAEVRRRRMRYSFSSRSETSKGLKTSTVRSLPLVPYGGDAEQGIAADCIICLSEFEERETVKMIPYCRHVFHPECIDTWLASHVSCPLCRSTKMFAER